MGTEERNMELMQTLDDPWNAQDGVSISKRENCTLSLLTRGIEKKFVC